MKTSICVLCSLAAFALAPAKGAENPDIILIMVDDMGYGDAACYNPQSKIPTPNIDRLARDGMRFTDAHASGPLCHVSRYGLMTGRYPFRAKFRWNREPVITDGEPTLATLLKGQGYRTAMVGKWHLGFVEKANEKYDGPLRGGPADRGFESYFGIRASTDIPPYFYIRGDRAVKPPTKKIEANNTEGWTRIQGEFWRAGGISPDLKLDEVLPRFTDEAVKVIESHDAKAKPLFLYLAYPAPHTPWLPSKEYEGKSQADLYGDFMVMVDAMIGKVLKTLDEQAMKKDTLVIFTSDNGPVWYDQDVEKFGHDSSGGLRGMKADAWEAGHRMPFIVRWPGNVKAGSTSDQTISFVDVFATFAEITNAKVSDRAGPDSFSFLPVLKGTHPKNKPIRGPLALKAGGGLMTLRDGDWKYIDGLGSGGFSQPKKIKPEKNGPLGQLYNLSEDVGETKNLYLEKPGLVAKMSAELKRILEATQTR